MAESNRGVLPPGTDVIYAPPGMPPPALGIIDAPPGTSPPGIDVIDATPAMAPAASRAVLWTDLGRLDYGTARAIQQRLVAQLKAGDGVDRLLLVEHEPVITLGRRADPVHVLIDRRALEARGIQLHAVERGGDVTYHGPGQLVAYPILDLRGFRKDVRWYSTALLSTVVRALEAFGIAAHARQGAETGVWVDLQRGGAGKIAALGVRIEAWVTYHGVAINVDTDLSCFDLIVPCGLTGVCTVSMATILGRAVDLAAFRDAYVAAFGAVFGVAMRSGSIDGSALAAADAGLRGDSLSGTAGGDPSAPGRGGAVP